MAMFLQALTRSRRAGGLAGVLLLAWLVQIPVMAAQPAANRDKKVEFQAEASREVVNDTLTAVLFAEANDASAEKVADALNRAMREALDAASKVKAVEARSGGYNTYPVYDRNQRLTGWRGRAEVRLESRDFAAATALIGKLQPRLQVGSIGFSIAPQTRRVAENELIVEAIQAFHQRAEVVLKALKGRRYALRHMAVQTQGATPPRPMMRAFSGDAAAEMAAPRFEGGRSTVSVSVSGTIEVE